MSDDGETNPPQGTPPPCKRIRMVPPSAGVGATTTMNDEPNILDKPSQNEGKAQGTALCNIDPLVESSPPDDLPILYASANTLALKLLQKLQNIIDSGMTDTADKKYVNAATAYLEELQLFNANKAKFQLNERSIAGEFCKALNAVLQDGFVVNHQENIGIHSTHSDVSGRYYLSRNPVLMVGEGKPAVTRAYEKSVGVKL